MIRLRRTRLAAALLGCLAVVLWLVSDDIWAAVAQRRDAVLPVAAKAELEVANDGWLRLRSLRLVCGSDGTFYLVLRARLAKRDFLALGKSPATVFIGDIHHQVVTTAELIEIGDVDTLVTSALTPAQVSDLARWFDQPPGKISFMTMERGVYMAGTTDQKSIQDMVQRCAQ